MDSFVAAKELARRKVRVADHILTQTYPLVQDPKLLVAVLQNLYDAVDEGIKALLLYELSLKRIPPFADSFDGRLSAFQRYIAPKYGVPSEFPRFVSELRETVREHRQSPVEFVRNKQLVICNESYRIRTLNAEQLKKHLQRAKAFIAFAESKVNRNDAVITRRG